MRAIHLQSPITGTAFCNNMLQYEMLTAEPPPHGRDVPALCKMCQHIREQYLIEEQSRGQEAWNNRPPHQKFHGWLVGLSRIGESDMAIIGDLALIICTCGLILIPKRIAKWLLKVGL